MTKVKFKETPVGFIPEDWKLVKIDDIKSKKRSSIAMGPFGSNITKDNFIESGVPVIRGGNFGDFKFVEKDFVYLSEEKADELKSSNVFPKDIILTHRGTLGQVGIIPENSEYPRYVVSQSQMKLTCDESKINPFYLFYFLKSKMGQHLFLMNASQTGVPAIARPTSSLKEIMVPLPPLTEQKLIVNVLKSINDKIELNQKMNQTLEEIGQNIFKHWFVHFEFPNTEGKPYKSSGGEMVDSDLGKIPELWNTVRLEDYMDFLEGPGIRNWQYTDEGIPFINIRLINDGEIDKNKANFVSEKELEKYSHFLLQENDLIISTSGTLGRYAVVRKDHLPLLLNTSVIRFRPKNLAYSYMYYYLTSNIFHEELLIHASGSVQLNFGPMHLKRIIMLLPEDNLQKKFDAIIRPLLDKMDNNRVEIILLESIRDSLLPKLMSGKIRVPLEEK